MAGTLGSYGPEDLREFRNNPDDNFMVALFADHWLR
jgi:hypothetical protein